MPKLNDPRPPGTGIRLLDDLIGAGPVPNATPPTTPQMRAATTYETYVQPAVHGLRNAVTKVMGDGRDLLGGLSPGPLAMAATRQPLANMADEAVGGLKRMLRENRNTAALTRYREQFDPVRLEAIEKFHERNPRLASTVEFDPKLPPDDGLFTPFEQGVRVGKIQLRQPRAGETAEHLLRTVEHEARHAVDARKLGYEGFQRQMAEEAATPYMERRSEQLAQDIARKRMQQRADKAADSALGGLIDSLTASLRGGK